MRERISMCAPAARAAAAAVVLVTAGPALADLSQVLIRVQATNSLGTGVWQQMVPASYDPDGQEWDWGSSPILTSTGVQVATLDSASFGFIADPQVALNFAVLAGGLPTMFTVTSALLSFPAINPAFAHASAAATVTDLNGDGASFTGAFAGGDAYLAQYNGFVPGGTTFTTLVGPLSVPAGGGPSASGMDESLPGGGTFVNIGGPVVDMSAQWSFTLSAGDLASGTSIYTISDVIPAPGAGALLALGGLAALRRSRR